MGSGWSREGGPQERDRRPGEWRGSVPPALCSVAGSTRAGSPGDTAHQSHPAGPQTWASSLQTGRSDLLLSVSHSVRGVQLQQPELSPT